jgi:CheY-like chemotaxis protein
MRVLIIDDEEDVRFIVRISLGRLAGMTVLEAPDAATGLSMARESRPDVILLDVMMPGTSGPDVFQTLQASPETASIPVVFLTADALPSTAARMMAEGAKGFLLKPFDPLSLASRLDVILRS